MYNTLRFWFRRLLENKTFVNYWAVLIADSFLSLFGTLVTLLFVGNFIENIRFIDYGVLLPLSFLLSSLFFFLLKIERKIIRHSTLKSMFRLVQAIFLKDILLLVLLLMFNNFFVIRHPGAVIFMDFFVTCVILILFRLILIVVYDFAHARFLTPKKRLLIYGTSDNSIALCKRLSSSPRYMVAGFLRMDDSMKSCEICDRHVYYINNQDGLEKLMTKYGINSILFPTHHEAKAETNRLLDYAQQLGLKTLVSQPLDEYSENKRTPIRRIKIEDLLGRDEININMELVVNHFANKIVMVTGAAGSIGSELCRQLATFGVKQLILFDNAESPLHEIRLELENTHPELKFVPFIGDVRQVERLRIAFTRFKPQVVFHAAAYKHVPLMEENPCEAVSVNVFGSRMVADLCLEFDVEEMVMISTDKAVNPTNVMGASKRMAEVYVQSLSSGIDKGEIKGRTRYITTRFGNVLGSNGSVIPYFRKQIEKGGPITVTHPDITRFFMTIPEACRLVMEAATLSTGNQIFVFDMGESVRILTLAERMIRLAGFEPYEDIDIIFTGLRPGEKLYEEVLSDKENTQPTSHPKIRIASVREYCHHDIVDYYNRIQQLAIAVQVDDCVKLMKELIPEFVSKNSPFEKFDVKEEEKMKVG